MGVFVGRDSYYHAQILQKYEIQSRIKYMEILPKKHWCIGIYFTWNLAE